VDGADSGYVQTAGAEPSGCAARASHVQKAQMEVITKTNNRSD
jgi:hypothetical protein